MILCVLLCFNTMDESNGVVDNNVNRAPKIQLTSTSHLSKSINL